MNKNILLIELKSNKRIATTQLSKYLRNSLLVR